MNKNRLTRVMDAALVAALALITSEMSAPWEQTLERYWEERIVYFRIGASALWLVALWLGLYGPFDKAKRVPPPVVLLGAARLLCTLLAVCATRLILAHYKALLSQAIYGAVMMGSALADFLLLLFLGRANADAPDCAEASRRWRRALAGALLILAAGLALAVTAYRRAMWMSVALAGAYLLALWIAAHIREKGREEEAVSKQPDQDT